MNSLRSLLQEGTKRLKEAGISSAALDARVLLSAVTSYTTEELILIGNEPVPHPSSRRRPGPSTTNDPPKGSHPLGGVFAVLGPGLRRDDGWCGGVVDKKFFKLIARRQKFEPIAYIVGQKEFYGINFKVNKNVLIPRPDSETVIELVKSYFKPEEKLSILDLGTGSGCLILTLLSLFPNSKGTGIDISDKALRVAKENASILNLTNRIEFIKSDWTNLKLKTRFDLVISNPPYITHKDIDSLQEDVRNYEPLIALAGGKDGLDCYREVFSKLHSFLKPDGACIFEIGAEQFDAIATLASSHGFKLDRARKDLSGIIRAVSFVPTSNNKI